MLLGRNQFLTCLMPEIKFYNISISSNNSELASMKTTNATITFMLSEYLEYQSNDSYIFTIVVVDNEEMRSRPTTKILVVDRGRPYSHPVMNVTDIDNEMMQTQNPVDVDTIEILTSSNGDVIIFWKEPNFDTCFMPKIKFYDVNIRCDDGELLSMETNRTLITFSLSDLSNNMSDISCMITIVVYNSEDMSSQPSSKPFAVTGIQNDTCMRTDSDNNSGEGREEDKLSSDEVSSEALAGLASLLAALLAIAIVIIVILSYKLYNQHIKKGEIVPPVVQHLNADNIEMQPSPAYVPFSQDSKVS